MRYPYQAFGLMNKDGDLFLDQNDVQKIQRHFLMLNNNRAVYAAKLKVEKMKEKIQNPTFKPKLSEQSLKLAETRR